MGIFEERSCLSVSLDSRHHCTETDRITLEIPRAASDVRHRIRRTMALPYSQERRLEAMHIRFCGRSLYQPTDIGLVVGLTSCGQVATWNSPGFLLPDPKPSG
jgi:hypothetical protein